MLGQYLVSYEADVMGPHMIDVRLYDSHIPGSPSTAMPDNVINVHMSVLHKEIDSYVPCDPNEMGTQFQTHFGLFL